MSHSFRSQGLCRQALELGVLTHSCAPFLQYSIFFITLVVTVKGIRFDVFFSSLATLTFGEVLGFRSALDASLLRPNSYTNVACCCTQCSLFVSSSCFSLKGFAPHLTDTGHSILMLNRRSGRSLSHGNVASGFRGVPDGQLEL